MEKGCGVLMVAPICQFEPLSYLLLNGLSDLAYQAWYELDSSNAAYDPDWEAYQRMEGNNELRFVSLRDAGNLIGYAAIVIQGDIHQAGVTMATLYDIYIIPKKRGYAALFVKYIERQLSALGVRRMIAGEKLNATKTNSAGKFYKHLGFAPLEIHWSKAIH